MTAPGATPVACCPNDGEPLVATFEYRGAEFVCMECRRTFGYFDPVPAEPNTERIGRQQELDARYREEYAERHPNEFPVDLATVDFGFDREPSPHDWSRWAIAWDTTGVGVPLVDGYRVTGHIDSEVRTRWSDMFPLEYWRTREPDPVGMQQAAAVAARIARENPGNLPPVWLAGWQKHAARVASGSRAEMCRHQGGTGAELRLIETLWLTFAQAQQIIEHHNSNGESA